MRETQSLSSLLQQYGQGKIRKKELEGLIFRDILENRRRFHLYHWNRDEYTDFLCWLYPRISRAIENYQNTGSTFDAYIGALLRWSAKEYRSREADHHATEHACWNAKALETVAGGDEPDYNEGGPVFKPVSNPRQVLMLLLKSYYFVSDDFIARAAPAIGIEKETLRKLIDELRKRRLQRDEEIKGLQERIYSQFYRCVALEKRISVSPEGSAYQEKLKRLRRRAKKRITSMRKRLASIRFDASNRQVAEVLGIPKGTVDSNLYAIKTRLKREKIPADMSPACSPGGSTLS